MAAKKQYSAQETSEQIVSTWMYKSNDDENSDTSESFSESEKDRQTDRQTDRERERENESDLEDTSINSINETAILMIASSSTNHSFHHHTTFSTVASSIFEAPPITSVAGASKFPNKNKKNR